MMGELFDNIFVLVPVALIIFLRVFADGARKRSEKARQAAAEDRPEPARPPHGSKPATQPGAESTTKGLPGMAGWAARKDSRQEATQQRLEKREKANQSRPARRDLLGRLRNYLTGSLDQLGETPEPLHFEEEAQRRLGQYSNKTTGSPGTKTKPSPGYRESLAGAMEESPAVVHEQAAPFTFPKRLERLTHLKRAIVLSEVLGKPKSLQ
jgi:hypothetical protein